MSSSRSLPGWAGVLAVIGAWTLGVLPARADHQVPRTPGGREVEFESDLRAFFKKGKVSWLGELKGRLEKEPSQFRYRSLTLGPYRRIHKNVKVGAFYRFQQGARHDDDWIQPPPATPDVWDWRDTRDRGEHLFILDATPRVELPFLPGESWVLALKGRYLYNTFNAQHTLQLKPGLTYFWMKGMDPFLNLFLNYELYLPLNYGVSRVYETWLYAGALYHASERVKVGAYGAFKKVVWGTSQAWKDGWPGEGYQVDFKSLVLGLALTLQFTSKSAP